MLGGGRSPLFGRFLIEGVGELGEKYAKELFTKAKGGGERDAKEAFKLVGGHPFYLLALAENRREGERMGETYNRILSSPTGALHLYVNYILSEDLGSGIRAARFIKILGSLNSKPLKVSQISSTTRIRLTKLPGYLGKLIDYDLIRKVDGEYAVQDKVIRDYFLMTSI